MARLFGGVERILVAVVLAAFAAAKGGAASGGPDGFGYTYEDSLGVDFDWVDISTTGTEVVFDGDDNSSTDPVNGVGAAVTLGFPFTFYGVTYTQLVPCANGYISTDPAEKGADASNDCPIPTAPDKGGGARLYVAHDDLVLALPTAGVFYQYFEVSPHTAYGCGVSVFSWQDAEFADGTGQPFSFQVLIFNSGDIYFQYKTDGFSYGTSSTAGMQDPTGAVGLQYACNTLGAIRDDHAVRFRAPTVEVDTTLDEFDTPSGIDVSLREAIRDVPPGGRVTFKGVSGGWRLTQPASLTIDKPLSLIGRYRRLSNGLEEGLEPVGMVFVIDEAPVHIENTTFLDSPGSAVTVGNGGALSLYRSEVRCARGSALELLEPATAEIVDTKFHGARLTSDETIRVDGDCRLVLNECAVLDSRGPAITFTGSKSPSHDPNLVLRATSLVLNYNDAVRAETALVLVENSTVSENLGAAIKLVAGELAVRHSTVVNNLAGLALNSDAHAEVSHSIVAANAAFDKVSRNVATDGSSTVTSLGYNLSDDAGSPWVGSGDLVGEPGLAPLGLHWGPLRFCHMPLHGSLAVDGGSVTPAAAPARDQRGGKRVADGDNSGFARIDIGSVEVTPYVTVTTAAYEDDDPPGANVSLKEAVGLLSPFTGATPTNRIVFSPSLSGSTITGITSLAGVSLLDASTLDDGIKLGLSGHIGGAFALHGVTLTGSDGSAVRHGGIEPITLTRCTINGNSTLGSGASGTRHGGGMYVAGSAFLNECRITANSAYQVLPSNGGGLAVRRERTQPANQTQSATYTAATVYLLNTLFRGNRSLYFGGALWAEDPEVLRIRNCTFDDNAEGAAYLELRPHNSVSVIGSSFVRNETVSDAIAGLTVARADSGPGELICSLPIQYCTFHGNRSFEPGPSSVGGAALLVDSVSADMAHCTVTENAGPDAGAIGVRASGGATQALLRVRNSVVTRNYAWALATGRTPGEVDVRGAGRIESLGDNYVGANAVAWFDAALDIIGSTPALGPLGYYGGPTPTRHPYESSPLIDAGSSAAEMPVDQRGLGSDEGGLTDIGSVEAAPATLVETRVDEFDAPAGQFVSLREAIRDAPHGGRLLFWVFSFITNPTIDLAAAGGGQGSSLVVGKSLVIDASSLPHGVTLSGPSASRVLDISGQDTDLALFGVSITDGNEGSTGGGLRLVDGDLTLTHSAVYDNRAGTDGAGMIINHGRAVLENVTLTGNDAADRGGAIYSWNDSELWVNHSTLAGNESSSGAAGVHLFKTDWRLANSVVAENFRQGDATFTPRNTSFSSGSTLESGGRNITDGSFLTAGNDLNATSPDLLPLVDAGGIARTRPPNQLSPVVNGGPGPFDEGAETDARGLPRPYASASDIGAYELGPLGSDSDNDNMDDYWENFYGLLIGIDDSGGNTDGDIFTHIEEFENETDPTQTDPDPAFMVVDLDVDPADSLTAITFQSVPGASYEIRHSTNVASAAAWGAILEVFGAGGTDETTVLFPESLYSGALDRAYFRIRKR